jgi:hypothetical protein
MTLGQTQLGIVPRPRWRATVVHGSVLAALLAGVLAFWSILALVAALLASPAETMATFQRKGAWGLPDVLRQGTDVLVSAMRPPTGGDRR